jgi:hypothetical protein
LITDGDGKNSVIGTIIDTGVSTETHGATIGMAGEGLTDGDKRKNLAILAVKAGMVLRSPFSAIFHIFVSAILLR